RCWDLVSASDAAYTTWLAQWTTDLSYKRELTTAEQGDSRLTIYHQFKNSEAGLQKYSPTKGSGDFSLPLISVGVGDYRRENTAARGLVQTKYDATDPRCTALMSWPVVNGLS